MRVEQESDGTWAIVDFAGVAVVRGFATNSAAWKWIDEHDKNAEQMEETRRRISIAIGQW
jgi:hypothetical protein